VYKVIQNTFLKLFIYRLTEKPFPFVQCIDIVGWMTGRAYDP